MRCALPFHYRKKRGKRGKRKREWVILKRGFGEREVKSCMDRVMGKEGKGRKGGSKGKETQQRGRNSKWREKELKGRIKSKE